MRLYQHISEENALDIITYELYEKTIPYLFSDEYTEKDLNEGVKDILGAVKGKVSDKIVATFKEVKKDLTELADDYKIAKDVFVKTFKSKEMFDLLKAFGFSLKAVLKSVNTLTGFVRKGLFDVFKELHKTKTFQKIRSGAVKVDDVVNKHPILNRIGGVGMAGLLFFIWTQMTFIGDMDYDMDFSNITAALAGDYSIADLLASPQGLMLGTLFATGGFMSVPWMGSTLKNLLIALTYTGYKKVKGNPEVLDKLKSKIKKTK